VAAAVAVAVAVAVAMAVVVVVVVAVAVAVAEAASSVCIWAIYSCICCRKASLKAASAYAASVNNG
jgi:hypothetical protein